ncbi:MAG TPA: DUF1573 domain-containing protein [Saprospiraceae bacterium]|jgi:uncharacterized protein DUF1573
MNLIKNLFAAMILVTSLAMIACQGDADDARAKARESLATTADGAATPATATPANVEGQPGTLTAENQPPAGPTTTMSFEHTDFDFGSVKEGEKVKHTYKFKNTGSEPLIISGAKGSCGCTVPKWPSEPIAPGASGQIDVEFDSKGKPGKQTKRVTVNANTVPTQTFLNISGNVEKDPNAPAAKPAEPAKK